MNLIGYGSMAGTPAFITALPIMTKAKYAAAIEKAVEKEVNGHPSVYPLYLFSGSDHWRIASPTLSRVAI